MTSQTGIDPNIVRWLAAVSGDMASMLRNKAPNLYLQNTRAVDTNALDSAVCSHLEWRDRLEELFAAQAADRLSVDIVSRDDLCALGRWIHDEGATRLGHLPEFVRLRDAHARFHKLVGSIVSAANTSGYGDARRRLGDPEYLETSCEVVTAVSELSRKLGDIPA